MDADVPDPETEQQAGKGAVPAVVNRLQEFVRQLVSHPFKMKQILGLQPV